MADDQFAGTRRRVFLRSETSELHLASIKTSSALQITKYFEIVSTILRLRVGVCVTERGRFKYHLLDIDRFKKKFPGFILCLSFSIRVLLSEYNQISTQSSRFQLEFIYFLKQRLFTQGCFLYIFIFPRRGRLQTNIPRAHSTWSPARRVARKRERERETSNWARAAPHGVLKATAYGRPRDFGSFAWGPSMNPRHRGACCCNDVGVWVCARPSL